MECLRVELDRDSGLVPGGQTRPRGHGRASGELGLAAHPRDRCLVATPGDLDTDARPVATAEWRDDVLGHADAGGCPSVEVQRGTELHRLLLSDRVCLPQPAKNSLSTGASAPVLTMCVWRSSVRCSAFGRTSASERIAFRIPTGLFPPAAT